MFYIIIIWLTLIVLFCGIIYYGIKNIETFTAVPRNHVPRAHAYKNIILLGDSVFKNNAYVKQMYSIEYMLGQKTPATIQCLAKDGATIEDVYKQINNISTRENNKQTIIFLSVGGNNILKHNSLEVNKLFLEYERVVNVLKNKFNQCQLVLVGLYSPPKLDTISHFTNAIPANIKRWNIQMKAYALTHAHVKLMPLDTVLYEPQDFVDVYEPSEVGGAKIVNELLKFLYK